MCNIARYHAPTVGDPALCFSIGEYTFWTLHEDKSAPFICCELRVVFNEAEIKINLKKKKARTAADSTDTIPALRIQYATLYHFILALLRPSDNSEWRPPTKPNYYCKITHEWFDKCEWGRKGFL